jgi:hypothetical protein
MISFGITDQFEYNVFITKCSPGNICQENSLVKIGQKYRKIYVKNYVLFVVAIDDILCSTQYFDTVDSDMMLNHTPRKHYCFSTAILVTPTRHNVT